MYRSHYNSTWSSSSNPVNGGRGMGYDEETFRIFENYGEDRIVHFAAGSSTGFSVNLSSYIGGDFSTGIACCDASYVYPFSEYGKEGTGVVVCARNSDDLWLFIRSTAGTWFYIGMLDTPYGSSYLQGLTYHEGTGYFYLLKNNSGGTSVTSFIILPPTALTRSTWGAIKSSLY